MKTFTDSELCSMFSVGGCEMIDGPSVFGNNVVASANSNGLDFTDAEWKLGRKGKTRVAKVEQVHSRPRSAIEVLVAFHAKRVAIDLAMLANGETPTDYSLANGSADCQKILLDNCR